MRAALALSIIVAALAACSSKEQPAQPAPDTGIDHSDLVFRDPETCRTCHAEHVRQWEGSMHAYAATDPLFHGIADVMTVDFGGELASAQFCTQCHTVPGTLRGETVLEKGPGGVPTIKTQGLSKIAQMGVSCDVCHSAARVAESFNANIVFEPNGTIRGPFGGALATDAHPSIESPLHRTGELCAGCHNVVLPGGPGRTVPLESTGTEWKEWKSKGGTKECQDCHMPARGRGPVAPGGPDRELHAHTFVGVDVALVDGFPHKDEQRALSEKLLAGAVKLAAKKVDAGLEVSLENLAGHAVPSGSTTERRMWIEARVTAATGEVVFQTGMLDANGDLMDGFPEHTVNPAGDPALWWFGSFVTATAASAPKKLVVFPHQATEIEERLLRPMQTATHTYMLPALKAGTYSARVRLLYRPLQPFFFRELEKHFVVKLDPALAQRATQYVMSETTLGFEQP